MKRICLMFAATTLVLGLSAPANAQYVWVDKNNVKHYSDKPPPPDIPVNRILKSPRGSLPAKQTNDATISSAANGKATSPPAKQAPMTTSEKNADFNKRKMEQEEKNKKAEEEKKRADTKEKNCAQARDYQRTLQSGQRIVRTGKSGDREYMDDAERARESQAVKEALRDCN